MKKYLENLSNERFLIYLSSMNFLKAPLLSLLLFLSAILSFSQQLVFKNFSTSDGLPSNYIYNIIQDKKGFLWIATENGVSRFDGNTFQNYFLKDGLADNEIFKIREDKDGRIWFLSYNGKLSIFHNGIFFKENYLSGSVIVK